MNKYELQVRVHELEQKLEFRDKEIELEKERIHIAEKEKMQGTIEARIKAEILAEQLQARLDESPYKQLEAILKALMVKLPTLDIKELSVKSK